MEDIIAPRNAVIIANKRWEDEQVIDIDFESADNAGNDRLDPGESITAVEAVSNKQGVWLAAGSAATTAHGADIDNDGSTENVVRYQFEIKATNPNDNYNSLPGLSTTLPLGTIGSPVELLPGSFVGPVKSFRILVQNRSDQFASPVDIPVDDIGAELHLRVLRGEPPFGGSDE